MFKTLMEEGTEQQVVKDLPLFVHFALAFGPVISLARDHVLRLITLDDDLIVKSKRSHSSIPSHLTPRRLMWLASLVHQG